MFARLRLRCIRSIYNQYNGCKNGNINQRQNSTLEDPVKEAICRAALSGKNIFFTGSAGTGKSYTLEKIVKLLRDKHARHDSVVVTAPTGVASLNVGGQTLQSFAGCGVPTSAKDFDKMLGKHVATRWKKLECLVIDEVGMLSPEFLDWLDHSVRKIREQPTLAMGGLQLIICGDFLQLNPIPG